MVTAASMWSDWLKFVPGWLAFLATVATWVQNARARKHSLAIGPDHNELRQVLTTAREQFDELGKEEPRRSEWFDAEVRRGLSTALDDQAARRGDETLKDYIRVVARTWEVAHMYGRQLSDPQKLEGEKWGIERHQLNLSHQGWYWARLALERLAELERRMR
ncbi:hypothetical protein [Streptomyces sp. NPDC058625]|uniref:hypothetical protein n=1 Tax=Streptomyces sp. NPDC058625 TaxID=3346564 RepID=UPI003652703C